MDSNELFKEICDECYTCLWYWQSRDNSWCEGEIQKCHEFILNPYANEKDNGVKE